MPDPHKATHLGGGVVASIMPKYPGDMALRTASYDVVILDKDSLAALIGFAQEHGILPGPPQNDEAKS